MLREYVPGLGERSTRRKIRGIFKKLDNKLSFQFFIAMFIIEAVKSFVAGNYYVAIRMGSGALLCLGGLLAYLEYGEDIQEGVEKGKEKVKEKTEEVTSNDE